MEKIGGASWCAQAQKAVDTKVETWLNPALPIQEPTEAGVQ